MGQAHASWPYIFLFFIRSKQHDSFKKDKETRNASHARIDNVLLATIQPLLSKLKCQGVRFKIIFSTYFHSKTHNKHHKIFLNAYFPQIKPIKQLGKARYTGLSNIMCQDLKKKLRPTHLYHIYSFSLIRDK